MPERVRITDVSPRDGLQNEPLSETGGAIPTERKAELVRAVAASGVDEVELTSFVSPKWVPQLGDAPALCAMLAGYKPEGVSFSALVPNERGMAGLIAANESATAAQGRVPLIDKASVFTAASETFSLRNTNASIAETLARFEPVIAMAKGAGLAVRGYISCVVECPFEGPIEPDAVAGVAERLSRLGVDEVDLGDTIGKATPETIARVIEAVSSRVPVNRLVIHLHDTFGGASDCVRESLRLGVRSFDGSAGGLGGCPYASTGGRRAPGNIATSVLVAAIESAGYTTGVDADRLQTASMLAEQITRGATS